MLTMLPHLLQHCIKQLCFSSAPPQTEYHKSASYIPARSLLTTLPPVMLVCCLSHHLSHSDMAASSQSFCAESVLAGPWERHAPTCMPHGSLACPLSISEQGRETSTTKIWSQALCHSVISKQTCRMKLNDHRQNVYAR